MRKSRAVVDTNVLVSGIISPKGVPRKLLDLARKAVFKVITSVSINHEILNVLHRDYIYTKYNLTEEIIDDVAAFLYEGTILTENQYAVSKVKKDPEDNKFIACALEGEADYIR
ncbi:MAG: putative toxin-antitoxin system toxin component, PIN family [Nitrospirota bacterium]